MRRPNSIWWMPWIFFLKSNSRKTGLHKLIWWLSRRPWPAWNDCGRPSRIRCSKRGSGHTTKKLVRLSWLSRLNSFKMQSTAILKRRKFCRPMPPKSIAGLSWFAPKCLKSKGSRPVMPMRSARPTVCLTTRIGQMRARDMKKRLPTSQKRLIPKSSFYW